MDNNPSIHYNRLRKMLGLTGFALPVVLIVASYLDAGCGHIQNSISAYYYTPFISVFCGLLVTIGFFLFTYPGYNWVDKWSTNIAGVLSVFIAIFPTTYCAPHDGCNTGMQTASATVGNIHIISAGAFFLIIAGISCFLFTRTQADKTEHAPPPTPEKILRNRIYVTCGVVIFITIGLLGINMAYCIVPEEHHPVFFGETICLFAFAVSWLIKGEALFKDGGKSFQNLPRALKPDAP